jgi:hypothetical protein
MKETQLLCKYQDHCPIFQRNKHDCIRQDGRDEEACIHYIRKAACEKQNEKTEK